ncbi:GNAT family N-acetyltransferase [Desulforamulus ferrireducens]|uniref:GNAT family N-acetyltransferase n=1 Tax=Desulforamulus ferrireducens TaxID=1833852 RepID=UPI001A9A4041|nr:GNAT family N-acetyltransferase [Desulforamulus ferrireducens]
MNQLPTGGVQENLANFLVAESQRGVLGVIGLEQAGVAVLLRSLTVATDLRKSGIATALVNEALDLARSRGGQGAYLLTNTAEKFMARWGFARIERQQIPGDLLQQSALNTACSACSICMKLVL